MEIDRLDHLVLTVADIAATVAFYERVLGFGAETIDGRTALHFGRQKINLHQAGHEFEPKAVRPTPGSGDLCFITAMAIDQIVADLTRAGISIIEGPAPRLGAIGEMDSIYFRDPDGNLIEVSRYRTDE